MRGIDHNASGSGRTESEWHHNDNCKRSDELVRQCYSTGKDGVVSMLFPVPVPVPVAVAVAVTGTVTARWKVLQGRYDEFKHSAMSE